MSSRAVYFSGSNLQFPRDICGFRPEPPVFYEKRDILTRKMGRGPPEAEKKREAASRNTVPAVPLLIKPVQATQCLEPVEPTVKS